MADGSRHEAYLVAESTYGTTPADPTIETLRLTGTNIAVQRDSFQSAELRSDRQIADFRLGTIQVPGDLNVELSHESFEDIILAVMMGASYVADTPVTGTKQAKAGITRRSFTFIRNFTDLPTMPYHIFKGVEFNTWQLSVTANAIVTSTFGIVGQSGDPAANLSGLGSVTTNDPTTTKVFDSFSGSILEGGNNIAVVTEVTLNLQNGLAPRFVIGSKETIRPSVARSNLTGQITAYFDSPTLLQKFLDETPSSLEFTLSDAAGNDMTFKIPNIVYTSAPPDVTDEGPITLALPFQALLDSATDTNFIIEIDPA